MKKNRIQSPDEKRVQQKNSLLTVGSMLLVFLLWFVVVPLFFPGLYAKCQHWLGFPP